MTLGSAQKHWTFVQFRARIARGDDATMIKRLAVSIVIARIALASVVHAGAGFEPTPVLKANDLAPASMLAGPRFTVEDRVAMSHLQPRFVVRSDFGVFEAQGRDMLGIRVHEVGALDQLEKTSKTDEFLRAAGSAAVRPVQSAANMVTHPVDTITGVPAAAGRFFDRVSLGAKSLAKSTDGAATTSEKAAAATARVGGLTADVLGYEAERRGLAKRLGVDPYTTNHVLSKKMDDLAWVAFSGRMGLNTVVAVVVPFSMAISATTIANDLVWDTKPADLLALDEKKLKAMDVGDERVTALMRTKWYSITMLTALVTSLEGLGSVKGRDQVVAYAATARSEDHARLIVRSVEMLARYHATAQPLVQLAAPGPIIARTKSGTTLVAAPLDYVAWTEQAAAFSHRTDVKAKDRTLWLTGTFSPRAKQEFHAAGWTLREGATP
jgi:hypothetical protein